MKSSTRNRTCLHLVVRSSAGAIGGCLAKFDEGDAVLFLDDGVMHITSRASWLPVSAEGCGSPADPAHSTRDSSFCFSAVDLEARGLHGLVHSAGARVLPDIKIAELIQSHDFCLTWK